MTFLNCKKKINSSAKDKNGTSYKNESEELSLFTKPAADPALLEIRDLTIKNLASEDGSVSLFISLNNDKNADLFYYNIKNQDGVSLDGVSFLDKTIISSAPRGNLTISLRSCLREVRSTKSSEELVLASQTANFSKIRIFCSKNELSSRIKVDEQEKDKTFLKIISRYNDEQINLKKSFYTFFDQLYEINKKNKSIKIDKDDLSAIQNTLALGPDLFYQIVSSGIFYSIFDQNSSENRERFLINMLINTGNIDYFGFLEDDEISSGQLRLTNDQDKTLKDIDRWILEQRYKESLSESLILDKMDNVFQYVESENKKSDNLEKQKRQIESSLAFLERQKSFLSNLDENYSKIAYADWMKWSGKQYGTKEEIEIENQVFVEERSKIIDEIKNDPQLKTKIQDTFNLYKNHPENSKIPPWDYLIKTNFSAEKFDMVSYSILKTLTQPSGTFSDEEARRWREVMNNKKRELIEEVKANGIDINSAIDAEMEKKRKLLPSEEILSQTIADAEKRVAFETKSKLLLLDEISKLNVKKSSLNKLTLEYIRASLEDMDSEKSKNLRVMFLAQYSNQIDFLVNESTSPVKNEDAKYARRRQFSNLVADFRDADNLMIRILQKNDRDFSTMVGKWPTEEEFKNMNFEDLKTKMNSAIYEFKEIIAGIENEGRNGFAARDIFNQNKKNLSAVTSFPKASIWNRFKNWIKTKLFLSTDQLSDFEKSLMPYADKILAHYKKLEEIERSIIQYQK